MVSDFLEATRQPISNLAGNIEQPVSQSEVMSANLRQLTSILTYLNARGPPRVDGLDSKSLI